MIKSNVINSGLHSAFQVIQIKKNANNPFKITI